MSRHKGICVLLLRLQKSKALEVGYILKAYITIDRSEDEALIGHTLLTIVDLDLTGGRGELFSPRVGRLSQERETTVVLCFFYSLAKVLESYC